MFVFTRRSMQQMLDSIAQWMPEGSFTELIGRLNASRSNRLPQMWELAWLYALGSVIQVEHERPLPNGKPDLWFNISDGGKLRPVVADITCVSDISLHAANPFEKLFNAVHEQAQKAGLHGGSFQVTASHLESGPHRAKKVQLLIPNGAGFDELVKRHLKPFTRNIASDPLTPQRLEVDEPAAKFVVEYKGIGQYSQGSHRSYEGTLSLENNVLFNRLRDKTRQLRGAPEGAVRMLVVCDGGCALLRRPSPLEGYSARQIAQHFLRGSQTIDVVALVTIVEELGILSRRSQKSLRCDLVTTVPTRPAHLADSTFQALTHLFGEAVTKLPAPSMMPSNSARRNLDSEWSASMEGAYSISPDKIKISARAVLELLAGAMSYERFAEIHRWNGSNLNMFRSRLQSGRLFTSARIESLDHIQDDDWLEFEFGPPDPAVSAFRGGKK